MKARGSIAVVLTLLVTDAGPSAAQASADRPDAPLGMLTPLTGRSWRAQGDGFASTLTYRWILENRLLEAVSELTDGRGQVIGRYHGAYAWDPEANEMVFWTAAESGELHRGRATWRDGVLWHEATVSGGRIQAYASAMRLRRDTLEYFAEYGGTTATPELLTLQPLTYRRAGATPSAEPAQEPAVEIRTSSGTALEQRGRDQLRRLLAAFDVRRWLFTRTIRIQSRVIPHSHPVLTLNTQYLQNDTAQLATFLHEQFHWFVSAQPDSAVLAVKADLRRRYPNAPAGGPEGARDLESTYLHLIVCALEYEAMAAVLGRDVARRTLEGWRHYRWVYRTVIAENAELVGLLRRHEMDIESANANES